MRRIYFKFIYFHIFCLSGNTPPMMTVQWQTPVDCYQRSLTSATQLRFLYKATLTAACSAPERRAILVDDSKNRAEYTVAESLHYNVAEQKSNQL